jgi:hypothetical protein
VADLDGDHAEDILLPGADGIVPFLWRQGEYQRRPALQLPGDKHSSNSHYYPLPELKDIDGDRLPDILVRDREGNRSKFHLLRNLGDGHFASPVDPLAPAREIAEAEIDANAEDDASDQANTGDKEIGQEGDRDNAEALVLSVAFFGDLDGDGPAEYLTEAEVPTDDDAGMRKEMQAAKKPTMRYTAHRMLPDFAMQAAPYRRFEAEGYALEADNGGSDAGFHFPGGLQDLDGDGRLDLISVSLDFSLLQIVRVLATQSISLGLDFHIWCQTEDGDFKRVSGLDLSGKFKIRLKDVRFGQLSQFAGDFDGDGMADFLQIGKGKTVTIHRGKAGCSYPAKPDLVLKLKDVPRNLALVQVRDLDGDGLSDLLVTQAQKVKDSDRTPLVRLDLYLSTTGDVS